MSLGIDAFGVSVLAGLSEGFPAFVDHVVTLRLSDRGYVTSPADSPANTPWVPRVRVPLIVEQSVPLAPEDSGRAQISLGEVEIFNTDGAYDAMIQDYAIDGRDVRVRVGTRDFQLSDFADIFVGTARGWYVADDETLRIQLRDRSYATEIPVQTTLYGGTGANDGGADLTGKGKPLIFGRCLNAQPYLVDPVKLIFQFHDGAAQALEAVYDQGLALTGAGDVADITSTSVSAGQWKSQLSGGYFRVGSIPAGLVTCDVQGDAAGGSYINKTSDIALRLLTTRAAFTTADIDVETFDALATSQPAPVGIFIAGDAVSLASVLDALFQNIGGWWGPGRFGRFRCGRVTGASGASTAVFNTTNILSLSRLQLPATVDPPNYRRRVGYQRNWTVQTSDLAATVTAARRAFLAQDVRIQADFDSAVQIKHLLAIDPPVGGGLFMVDTDALAEAQRLLALWGADHMLIALVTKIAAYTVEIGATVTVEYPRFSLDTGADGQVVGKRIDADLNQVTLTVLI